MKFPNCAPHRSLARLLLLAATLALALPAAAALTDLADAPLASSSSGSVKPNISFVLDTSGSMAWSHAPDEAQPFAGAVGYASSHCNSIYYDPNITYVVPKNADSTDFPNSSFTGAWVDGYRTGSGTRNLSTSFIAYDSTTSAGAGTDTAQPAYYYTYNGTQTPDFKNTGSQFYTECNSPAASGPEATLTLSGRSNTSVSSIKVNGVETMSGSTSSSNNPNSVASRIASNLTRNGFTASSSSNVVTIIAPNSTYVGATPVVTKSGGMIISVTAFTSPPFTKHVVSSTSGPSGTDERQNFANWFSYYRTRILMMKSGAGRAFASVGDSYRVGFQTIYATPGSSSAPAWLQIDDFGATQKSNWFSDLYAQSPSGSTPLKLSYSTAARVFAGKIGPDPVQYSCQQNFLILTTDGYWNAGSPNPVNVNGGSLSPASQDSNATLTPRPMYDGQVSGASNTLADAAAYYYNTDLRQTAFSNCTSPLTGLDVCQNNVPTSPQDSNPAQHVTTFTLGLGTNGQLGFAQDYLTGGSADYNAITSGTLNWPDPVGDTLTTIDDLWHAAVNGHGEYFAAKNPDLLVSGLRTALAGVSTREASGAAAATSNLEPVAGDNFAYVANYRTVKWDGELQARTIDLNTGQISSTAVWSAQALLDAAVAPTSDSRNIFTFLPGSGQVPFVPTSFTSAQKASWFNPTTAPTLSQTGGWTSTQTTAATPDTVINFLRGQSGFEERTANATELYRLREHVLGDIIDGKPVYVKKPPFEYTDSGYLAFKAAVGGRRGMVYAAANDGMLHAFDSLTGQEVWAYVPSFVLPNLKALADDNYANAHQYYVDGSPVASDVFDGSNWRTILVGGLNGGGKGYYCLDITDPNNPVVLWEFSDANLGFSYGNPIIGKLADGSWVVVVSSGYNNVGDGVGRLFVLNAATGSVKFTVSTGVGTTTTPSGLARISGVAVDALTNNTIDRLYGGDLLGNLWRFDINDTFPPAGKEATKLASFIVSGTPQPITTAPEIGSFKTSLGATKYIAFVGTGRYLGPSDLADTSQQSFYAILDGGASGVPAPVGDIRNSPSCPVVKQTLQILDATHRSTSQNTVNFNSDCAWYLDFNPSNDSPGERVNVDPVLQLGVLAVATNVPEKSVCTLGGTSWLYFFDFLTGEFVSTSTGNVAGTKLGNSITVGLNTYRLPDGRVITTPTQSDDTRNPYGNPYNPVVAGSGKRATWRELLN